MRKQTWYERIIIFFSKIFHKDSIEMNNKFKKEMCEKVKSQNLCEKQCYCCAWYLEYLNESFTNGLRDGFESTGGNHE